MKFYPAQVIDALERFNIDVPEGFVEYTDVYTRVELNVGQPLESGVVYVSDIDSNTGSVAVRLCDSSSSETLHVHDATSSEVLNAFGRYMASFENCLETMRDCYYVHRDVQGLCQALSDFVGNPVLAYDDSLLPMAQTEFPLDFAMEHFGAERMDARYVFKTIPLWERGEESTVFTRQGAERIGNSDGTAETAVCRIVYDGEMQGFLEIFAAKRPITDGHMKVLEEAVRIVSVAIPFRDNSFLLSRLAGHGTQSDLAGNWLASLKCHPDDGIYVLAVDLPNLYSDDKVTMVHAMRMLRSVLPGSVCAQMDETPVLVGNDKLVPRDRALKQLLSFLATTEGDACIGASEVMVGIGGLHEGYVHARFAARFAREHLPQGGVVLFEECRFAFLYDLCDFESNGNLVLDAKVARIFADDKATGSDNTLTAKVYIETGFNLNATAARLSVHRNTVAYRLKVLADRYGLDLSSPVKDSELVFQTLLSCRILLDEV